VYGSEAIGITIDQVEELIRNLGLESMFDNLEQGLMSLAGKNGSKLSGGQRQVVWILRVLLQEPEILLLDEPTASIDVETKDTIYALLSKLMHDRTVVMVTHDEYLLQHCDRVIELGDRGTILSDAPPTHKTAWLQS
jgi:ABC-type bacteriocin/lantibiotic exporter with double-glycine peptidase domain